jgi:CubicO group peptidase (beta-lactamase class C family)
MKESLRCTTARSKLTSLFAVALLSVFAGSATAGAEETSEGSASLAPEATEAEATLPFRELPVLDEAFIDTAPADRHDGLAVGRLGVDGGNKEMIVALAREIADGEHGSFDSLLIAQKGKLLFESYYLRGRVNLPHPQASATKTYVGLAVGRAIQLGHLTMADLDLPLVGFLDGLDPTRFVEGAETITLHKAMTMRSGIRISEEQWEEFEEDSEQVRGQTQVQTYLEHSAPITAESQSFDYQGADPQLVMQVIEAVVPGTAGGFIRAELLDKLGITEYGWETDVSGLPTAGNGASMTSRDMVKWGTLAMNEGRWNGEPLVPEAFISKATNRIVDTDDEEIFGGGDDVSNSGYGYFWWQADLRAGDRSLLSTSAQGGGGQFIILIDELDLIVVATGHEREVRTLQMTAERILPAFIQ